MLVMPKDMQHSCRQMFTDSEAYAFTHDAEFSSPSAAAAVIHGGGANGLTAWRDAAGKTLKVLEEA
jgi:hypothetical protein